ncbi:hypothetical protein VKT23_018060 [Stygiomarasmius scandens]|uniref:F-box domain-containing protein n=1 Tax=Marasmiellus scandens TaxID=2682957 RepID=A0ABR1ITS6_9AGAR
MSAHPTIISLCDECSFGVPQYHDHNADLISHQLRSYRTPTEIEVCHLRAEIDSSERVIDKYSEEITKLQKRIEVLQMHKARAVRAVENRQALLAPINRLPVEILEVVFDLVCCGEDTTWYTEDCPFFVFPFTLDIAHTCTAWRRIVLSKGELWSDIDLLFHPDHVPRDINKPLELLANYLPYSKSAPLTITIRAYPGPLTQKDSARFCRLVQEALEVLVEHAGRWKSVDLSLNTMLFDHLKSSTNWRMAKPLSLPLLRSLTLDWNNTTDEDVSDNWSSLGDIFANAPICRLSIPYYNLEALPCLPFSQLTTLDIRETERRNLLLALRSCPLLEHLSVQEYQVFCRHVEDSFPHADNFVICPRLVSLRLYVSAPEKEENALLTLFSYLEIPALRDLCIRQESTGMVLWSKDAFAAMISRSSCHLDILSIRGIELSSEDIRDVFRLSPTLRQFDFEDSPCALDRKLVSSILQTLTTMPESQTQSDNIKERQQSHAFVPLLESLHLCTPLPVDTPFMDTAYAMLQSRAPDGIQTISLAPRSPENVVCSLALKDFELRSSSSDPTDNSDFVATSTRCTRSHLVLNYKRKHKGFICIDIPSL